MNFLKRACCSVRSHYRNWLLVFVIFTAAFLLVLLSFAMLSGANRSAQEMRSRYQAKVTVRDFATRSYDIHDKNLIAQETVERLGRSPLVKEYSSFYYSTARTSPELQACMPEEQAAEYVRATAFRVEGTADLQAAAEFAVGNNFVIEGREFQPGETDAVLVSVDVAELNGLKVGDEIRLPAYYTEKGGVDVTAELVGIYGIETYQPHTEDPYFNSENLIYVTPDVAEALNGPGSNAYSVTCTIADPEQAEAFVGEVQNMGLAQGDDLRFSIDDGQYRAVKNSISSMTGIAAAMLLAAILVGCAVLVLLTLISLKGRDYEIGVLLALGEGRGKVILQLVLESLFPVLLAATAAVCCGPLAESWAAGLFGNQTAENVRVTGGAVAALYGAAVLLTLAASLVTVYKICKYQPKKILTEVG